MISSNLSSPRNLREDIRAQRPAKTQKQRISATEPTAVIDRTPDSESDVPVSSGQWPASPELNQLPPDSSFASPQHSDHSFERISDNPHQAMSSQRQSSATSSSHSTPRRPAREPVSPTYPSPSFMSTSAGGEFHRFTCQASGCDKSYKNPRSLKYHMDVSES